MAQREELRLDVKVTGDDDVKKLSSDIEDLFDTVDKFGTRRPAELVLTSKFGKIEGEIADLVLKLETLDKTDPEVEVTIARLNQLQGDLDAVIGKIKEVDSLKAEATVSLDTTGIEQGLGRARQGADDLSQSAGSSRNALANMVGNSAQDLSGLSSSLGVAIGQLAEFSADAALSGDSLKNIGRNMGVAFGAIGGIAAASALISKVTGSFETLRQSQEKVTEETKNFAEAVREAESVTEALNQTIAEGTEFTGQELAKPWQELMKVLPFVSEATGDVAREQDTLIGAMAGAGVTADEWTTAVSSIGTTYGELSAKLRLAHAEGRISDDQFDLLIEQLDLYRLRTIDATEAEANRQAVFADGARSAEEIVDAATRYGEALQDNTDRLADYAAANVQAADSTQDIANALGDLKRETGHQGALWDRIIQDMRDGEVETVNATSAWNELRNELNLTEEEMAAMAQSKFDEKLEAEAEAAAELAEKAEEARLAIVDLANSVVEANVAIDSAAGRADAFGEALERMPDEVGAGLETAAFVDKLNAVGDAIAGLDVDKLNMGEIDIVPTGANWQTWLDMPDEAQAVLDALSGFGDAINTEMTQAFESGGEPAVKQWAANTRQAITDELHAAGVTSQAAIDQVLSALGLLPEQVTTTVNIAIDEQQLTALQSIASGLDLPPDVAVAFQVAINNQDPDTALRILNGQLALLAVPKTVSFTIDPVTGDMDVVLTNLETTPHTVPVTTETDTSEVPATLSTVEGAVVPVATDTDTSEAADALLDETSKIRRADIVARALTARAKTELDALDDPRTATITAVSAGVAAVDTVLNNAARLRYADIYALSHAQNAENSLNLVARDRDADINAATHGADSANATLDFVARDRTADIYVVTHNTTISTPASGGGGAGAGTLAAPMAAPMTLEDEDGVPTLTAAPTVLSSPSPVAVVPAGATVTNNLQVTVQAAVIGNRHEVERTVAKALRGYTRLNGNRNN